VQVAGLGDPGPGGGHLGQGVAFDERDPLDLAAQGDGGGEPAEAGADDDGVGPGDPVGGVVGAGRDRPGVAGVEGIERGLRRGHGGPPGEQGVDVPRTVRRAGLPAIGRMP
jgi:hypothetical protein